MRKTDAKTLKSCLPQWLREHGLPLHKPFACLNPAHRDAHPSMGYNEKNQTVHCFACGATYDIFDLVGQEENLTLRRGRGHPGHGEADAGFSL